MSTKTAKANVEPVRQRTQYTCMATSLMMCLKANGIEHLTEDEVNNVMGARPMKGARWEEAMAAAQHYGMRATLTTPATVAQLKEWTDQGIPVMIAWNPEGREWSHASVVFDVDGSMNVYVADPNIPDPDETVRVVPKAEFYSMWAEKWPNYLVRRPAMAIEPEITKDGKQVMASKATFRAKAASTKVAEAADCWKDWKAGGLTWAEYQECVKRFEGGGGGYRRRAPLSNQTTEAIAKNLMAYALKGMKAKKGIKFLTSLLTKNNAMTPKQQDWFDNIQKSNARYTSKMPAGMFAAVTRGGQFAVGTRASQAAKKWVEDNLETDAQGFIAGPKAKVAPQNQAPVPKPSVDSALGEKVTILKNLLPRLRGGDQAHIKAVLGLYESGQMPDADQLKKVRHLLYKNRMRNEANHFRMAGWTRPILPEREDKPHKLYDVASHLGVDADVIYDLIKQGRVEKHRVPGTRGWVVGVVPAEVRSTLRMASKFGPQVKKVMLEALDKLLVKSTDYIVHGLRDVLEQRGWITSKQKAIIIDEFRRHNMLEDAFVFTMPGGRWAGYDGNPDGKDIYEAEIDHGYEQPLSGGTDVMKRLQDKLLTEQGNPERDKNPRLAMVDEDLMDRAAKLLWYMDERDAIKHLVEEGVSRNDAFLAVKAGKLLNERREKGRRADDHWDQWKLSPETPSSTPALIEPERRQAVDPDAADSFWFTSKEPAEVWRNKFFATRSVMESPQSSGYFCLVPPEQVGRWGGAGWQMVSPPNNPRTAENTEHDMDALDARNHLANNPQDKTAAPGGLGKSISTFVNNAIIHTVNKSRAVDKAVADAASGGKAAEGDEDDEKESRHHKGPMTEKEQKEKLPAEWKEWTEKNKGQFTASSLDELEKMASGDEKEGKYKKNKPLSKAEKAEWRKKHPELAENVDKDTLGLKGKKAGSTYITGPKGVPAPYPRQASGCGADGQCQCGGSCGMCGLEKMAGKFELSKSDYKDVVTFLTNGAISEWQDDLDPLDEMVWSGFDGLEDAIDSAGQAFLYGVGEGFWNVPHMPRVRGEGVEFRYKLLLAMGLRLPKPESGPDPSEPWWAYDKWEILEAVEKKLLADMDKMGKAWFKKNIGGRMAADDGDDEKSSMFEEGSKPSDEEITKNMSPEDKAKWMANKGKVQEKKKKAARTLRDNDGRVWGPKKGLEGPIPFKGGRVLYYDPREGAYYDPTTDLYLSHREFESYTRAAADKTALSWAGQGLNFRDRYLQMFFKEKNLPIVWWNLRSKAGETHTISNQTVLEFLAQAPNREKKGVGDMIRKIDFHNGDVNDYLKHLAGAIINNPGVMDRLASKQAAPAISEMYALVHQGRLLGATDHFNDARTRSYWSFGERNLLADEQMDEAEVVTLIRVPMDIAVALKDVGTPASRLDPRKALRMAKPYMTSEKMRLAKSLEAQWAELNPAPVQKEARVPTGLYGFTRKTQKDVEASIRKLQRKANAIAKAAFKKDADVAPFLATHAKRAKSPAARALVAALKNLGPKVASETKESMDLSVFNRQHPWHRDLDHINSSREKVRIGPGRFEIPGRRAGMMVKAGLVDIIEDNFGKYLEITSKGRRSLDDSMDTWEKHVMASKTASVSSAKKLIKKYLAKGKPFTFQDVYEDDSDPTDGDLYDAFSEMVKAGEIDGPDPRDKSTKGNHDDWKYKKKASRPLQIGDSVKLDPAVFALPGHSGLRRMRNWEGEVFNARPDQAGMISVEWPLMGGTNPRMKHHPEHLIRVAKKAGSPKEAAKIPDQALVRVDGFVMLKGLDEGTYRVQDRGDGTYQFYKPRGKRPLARHYTTSVDISVRPEGHRDLNKIVILRTASTGSTRGKEASYGMYGYRSKVATLGLNACASLKVAAGSISADLHRRRADKHAKITAYLAAHTKKARCQYARMLNASYPAFDVRLASAPAPTTVAGWLAWEDED
jgi:predicted double-glycine peptidase